jgi:hypothetical protein
MSSIILIFFHFFLLFFLAKKMDSRLRGNDGVGAGMTGWAREGQRKKND